MALNRKTFIKEICFAAVCSCGFSTLAFTNNKNKEVSDNSNLMLKEWIAVLLINMQNNMDKNELRRIVKKGAIVHYNNLCMDAVLHQYIGNLNQFILFLEDQWGWKISYNKNNKTLIASENKSNCVCPLINPIGNNSSVLCYCSEGFAELMFSKVTEQPVKATVKSSILRGDQQCKYEIIFQ
jgi:hypothetical protein